MIMTRKPHKPSHHASTIVEAQPGVFLAAWFAGTFEGHADVGIWLSRRVGDAWSAEPQQLVAPNGLPLWNPVLAKLKNGEILLFYKIGKNPTMWKGYLRRSTDGGLSWGPQESLPPNIIGPAKNKPLQLADGTLLAPSSVEKNVHGTKHWSAWVEETKDNGRTWSRHGPIELDGKIIQPSLFNDDVGNVVMVARTRKGFMASAISYDQGHTWSPAVLTSVPCPNAGLDAVRLRDGRVLLVYNHSFKKGGRGVLAVAVSDNAGEIWERVLTLEDSGDHDFEYSYPAVIQAGDGMVHVTYTWRRENIKHVILDPAGIRSKYLGNP
eukprot:jgi/Mesvir1/5958/Mv00715-RA.1